MLTNSQADVDAPKCLCRGSTSDLMASFMFMARKLIYLRPKPWGHANMQAIQRPKSTAERSEDGWVL